MKPKLSKHFKSRKPSVIRQAQIIFSNRKDKHSIQVINVAIGNVSLPMYPKMKKRMEEIGLTHLMDGVLRYTPTVGTKKSRNAFINIISANVGFKLDRLNCLVTDGGSQAMEIMMLGVCGPVSKRPLMVLDPSYTNYIEFSNRLSIPLITSERYLMENGNFEDFNFNQIEDNIKKNNPSGLLIIPYDNPTGQLMEKKDMIRLAKLCVKYNLWFISDEAYRGLSYKNPFVSNSIWSIDSKKVPGIYGRRISIESASKVWNACGLRIGAIVTDNDDFHEKSVSEYTANLCANSIGQEIFSVLADEDFNDINKWINKQRKYYMSLMKKLRQNLINIIPGLIVSKPQASIYMIIDFRNIVNGNFNAREFVKYCASKGKVNLNGKYFTLLIAPMERFYMKSEMGRTQLRLAMVEKEENIKKIPEILYSLYISYTN